MEIYPDSSLALKKWGQKNGYNPEVLEHYTNFETGRDIWNDYVSITIKDKNFRNNFKKRIIDTKKNYNNENKADKRGILNFKKTPKDQQNWDGKLN